MIVNFLLGLVSPSISIPIHNEPAIDKNYLQRTLQAARNSKDLHDLEKFLTAARILDREVALELKSVDQNLKSVGIIGGKIEDVFFLPNGKLFILFKKPSGCDRDLARALVSSYRGQGKTLYYFNTSCQSTVCSPPAQRENSEDYIYCYVANIHEFSEYTFSQGRLIKK